ncbi:glucose-1-phosphate adenylyltransferase [compost metagenome]
MISDSVIMPGVSIGKDVTIHKAIIGEGTIVEDEAVIGSPERDPNQEIVLIGSNEHIGNKNSLSVKG